MLYLDDRADLHVAHRRLPVVAERRRGDRHAAALEARHRRPRAVDRIDDEHLRRGLARGLDQAAVLRVEGDLRRALREEPLEKRLGLLVDRERDVATGAGLHVRTPGVRAQLRQYVLAQPEGQFDNKLSHV